MNRQYFANEIGFGNLGSDTEDANTRTNSVKRIFFIV